MKNLIHFSKTKTLNEILTKDKIFEPKRCVLATKNTYATCFTPWYLFGDCWVGVVRWYGRNNKHMEIGTRKANDVRYVKGKKIAILPKNHKLRIVLDSKEKIQKSYWETKKRITESINE